MAIPTLKTIALNETCQIGVCANAITVQEITDADRRGIGIKGDMQLIIRFPGNRELRVPVTMDALFEANLDPSLTG